MIFRVDTSYLDSLPEEACSDMFSEIASHGHFIDCDAQTRDKLYAASDKNGSKTQKQFLQRYNGFDITAELRTYLRTIDLTARCFSYQQIMDLVTLPSLFLLENEPYEWPVYRVLIGTYENDRKFRNLFHLLVKAKNENRLIPDHCGGYTPMPAKIHFHEENRYKEIFPFKSCILFDRDTDDAISFDSQKDPLFVKLTGKKSNEITDADIYTLSQGTYNWHMWYKRAIENYFPNAQYEAQGMDVSELPEVSAERDYKKICGNTVPGYDKNKLPKIAEKMSRTDYERNLKKFSLNQMTISELQLLLLKLVKTI